jgi:hypothetical protein
MYLCKYIGITIVGVTARFTSAVYVMRPHATCISPSVVQDQTSDAPPDMDSLYNKLNHYGHDDNAVHCFCSLYAVLFSGEDKME